MSFSNREVEESRTGEPASNKIKYRWARFLLPLTGLFALIWFLIRVIPKPSRVTYPCQRVAFPLASSFVIWLLGLGGSVAAIRKAKRSFAGARWMIGVLCIGLSVGSIWLAMTITADEKLLAAQPHPTVSPVGVAKGIYPGRVAWVHDPDATNWGGTTDGFWYESNHTDQTVVYNMLSRAVRGVAGNADLASAWDSIFRYYNQQNGKGDVGYSGSEKIMIKVNMVGFWAGNASSPSYGTTSNYMNASPQMMHAILDQLVNIVGVAEADITIGDQICHFVDAFYNYLHTDFPGVHYLDKFGASGRTATALSSVPFYWSTSAAAGTTQDYVPLEYVNAEYLINMGNFKGHYDQAGITLTAKNHYGSLKRNPNAGGYYDMHADLPFSKPGEGMYRTLVDLMGHPEIGAKTVLYLIDGLYAGRHQGGNIPIRWSLSPFGDPVPDWTSSVFASLDPVAIDSVGFDFLYAEWPENPGPAVEGTDDYLNEAAQADNAPSGTGYNPTVLYNPSQSSALQSLGVHEHWDDPVNKRYSRNLGVGEGIELVQPPAHTIPYDLDFDGKIDLDDYAIMTDGWDGSLWDYLVVLISNWLDGESGLPPIWVFDGVIRSPWTTGGSDNIPFVSAVAPDASDALVADMPAGQDWRWTTIPLSVANQGDVIGERIYLEFDLFFDTDSKPGHTLSAFHIQVNDVDWTWKWDAKDPDYPVPSMCWIDGVYQDLDCGIPNNDMPMTGMEWHHFKLDLTTNVAPTQMGVPQLLPVDAEIGIIRLCFGHDLAAGGGIAYIKNVAFTSPPDYGGNKKPWVNAGPAQALFWPDNSLLLDGTVVDDGLPDPPGQLTILWELVDGPGIVSFANEHAVDTMATFSTGGTYILRLTADDGAMSDSSETVVDVIPENYPAGSVYVFNDGSFQNTWQASNFDIATAPDGNTALWSENTSPSYPWSRIGSSAPTQIGGNIFLEFDAYFDTTAQPANTINAIVMSVNGSGTFDWKWEAESQIWVDGFETRMDAYSVTGNTWHHFKLELHTNTKPDFTPFPDANDDPNIGEIAMQTPTPHSLYLKRVAFTNDGVTNMSPAVDAGANQEIVWPANTVSLDGTVTDDGLPSPPAAYTVTWSKTSGPGTVTFGNANAEDTTATFSAAGTYILRLTANDGILNGFDEVTITVRTNQAPSVDAGTDQQITLPVDSASLDATVTDDGLPDPPATVTVSWEKISGPGSVTFGSATSVDTTATFSMEGTYVLRLTADDSALSGSDDVTIVVKPEGYVEIEFDAVSSVASSSQSATVSWDHTVGSGNNRILVVGTAIEDTSASDIVISSVTYNGIPMSEVAGTSHSEYGSSRYMKSDLYYLLNPPSGTHSVQITYAGSVTYKTVGAISLANVAQQAREAAQNNGTASGSSISTDINVPTSGSWVVDVVGSGGTGTWTATAVDMTERWNRKSNSSSGASSTKPSSGGVTTMSYSNTNSSRVSHSVASFAPAE